MLIAVDLESWGWQLDGQFFTGVWERQSWETSLCRRVLRMVLLSSWHRAKTKYIMHQISFSWASLLGLNGIQYTVYGYLVFDLELKAQVQVPTDYWWTLTGWGLWLFTLLLNALRVAFTVWNDVIKDVAAGVCPIHFPWTLIFVFLPSVKISTQSTDFRVVVRWYLQIHEWNI